MSAPRGVWRAVRRLLLTAASLLAWGHLPRSATAAEEEVLAVKPLVVVWKDFASPAECQQLLGLLERCHKRDWPECTEIRSRLHSKAKNGTGASGKRQWRNSTSYQLQLNGELDPAVDGLVRRAHLVARHPITYGEGVQVASYHAGDYYEFHHDSLNRRATFLLYVTDIPEGDGGETIFPLVRAPGVPEDRPPPLPPAVIGRERENLDFKVEKMLDMAPYCESDYYLKIRPEAGKAVLFFSYGPDYGLDQYAIHGSCPLHRGHKAIFQRWMRFGENSLFKKAAEAVQQARTFWGHDRLLPPSLSMEAQGPAPGAAVAAAEGELSALAKQQAEGEKLHQALNASAPAPSERGLRAAGQEDAVPPEL